MFLKRAVASARKKWPRATSVGPTMRPFRYRDRGPATEGAFTYNRGAFNGDGTVKAEALDLSDPTLENCAQCHGFTARNTTTIQPIQHADIMRGTEKAGWIYNGAKISDTVSPNIVGKEKMDFPWDVHAAAGLICIDCHFSVNNPGRMIQEDPKKNLRYKPSRRRLGGLSATPRTQLRAWQHSSGTVNLTSMTPCARVAIVTRRKRDTHFFPTNPRTCDLWLAKPAIFLPFTSGHTEVTIGVLSWTRAAAASPIAASRVPLWIPNPK